MPPPIRIGPFELVAPIGRGGMGEVWEGRHQGTGLPVAVKIAGGSGDVAESESRLGNELRALARLNHPCVVQLYDVGRVDADVADATGGQFEVGTPYLVLELVSGGRLGDLPLESWPRLRAVLLMLLESLAHVHARGIIHCDVKSSNVLLDGAQGRAGDPAPTSIPMLKLTDFGLALDYERPPRDVVQAPEAKGTPHYMAPEVIEGRVRDQGPWTDLYALGCLAYQLVAGRLPFESDDLDQLLCCHLHVPAPTLMPRFPVPSDFSGWIDRLLSKAPRDRFRWAAEASRAMLSLKGELRDRRGETGSQMRDRRSPQAKEDATTQVEIPVKPSSRERALPWGASPRSRPRVPVSWRRAPPEPRRARLRDAGLGLVGLRAPLLVGRERERRLLWSALRRVQSARRARVVVLRGGVGGGKSRLALWLAQRVRELGLTLVLHAEARPGRDGGLGPTLAQLLRCTGLDAEQTRRRTQRFVDSYGLLSRDVDALMALMRPVPSVATDVPSVATDVPTSGATIEDFTVLRRLLGALCADSSVVVCLDDVQWAEGLIRFGHHLLDAQSVMPLPVLVVLTVNEETLASELGSLASLGALLTHPEALAIEVGPLTRAEQTDMHLELLPLDRAVIARLVARSRGNGGLANALVLDAVRRGAVETGPYGFTIDPRDPLALADESFERWSRALRSIDRGDERVSRALELAAAIGHEVSSPLWRKAGVELPVGLVSRLVRARLARRRPGGWSFAQPAIRCALERQAREASRWRGDHDQLARLLARDPGRVDPGRVGYHLLEAGRPRDSLEPLLRGLQHALERGDHLRALLQLDRRERALLELGCAPDHPERLGNASRRARIGELVGEDDGPALEPQARER